MSSFFKGFCFLIGFIFVLLLIFQARELFSEEKEVFLSEHIENVEVLPSEIVIHLPSDINEQIAYYVKYFTTEKREVLQRWFKRCGPYLPYFRVIFKEEGLPEDLVYLALVESGCNPFAVSRAGAVGIWQFVEGTARFYGLKIDFWIDERKDFIKSTYAASRYLKKLYEVFGDWRIAVASYNAGEGRISRALKAKNFADYWKVMMSGSIPFETFAYVPQWLAVSIIAKNPQKYGFEPIDETPWEFVEVEVPGGLDLKALSLAAGTDLYLMRSLNAELRREFTPPNSVYPLKIPSQAREKFLKNLSLLPLEPIKVKTPEGEVTLFTLSQEGASLNWLNPNSSKESKETQKPKTTSSITKRQVDSNRQKSSKSSTKRAKASGTKKKRK